MCATPPSTYSSPRISTGVKSPGTDADAMMALSISLSDCVKVWYVAVVVLYAPTWSVFWSGLCR